MQRSTLVVDDDEQRRRHIVHALSRRGLRYLDVADAFGAMAALGRADFGAVIAAEGRRTLSLRGLCQLARRRHPDVVIFVIHREGSDPSAIPGILGVPVEVIAPTLSADGVAAAVEKALLEPPPAPAEELEWQHLPQTTELLDEDPTIKTPVVPQPAAQPASFLAPPLAATPSAAPAPAFVAAPTLADLTSPMRLAGLMTPSGGAALEDPITAPLAAPLGVQTATVADLAPPVVVAAEPAGSDLGSIDVDMDASIEVELAVPAAVRADTSPDVVHHPPPVVIDPLQPDEQTERMVREATATAAAAPAPLSPLSMPPVTSPGPLLEGLLDGGSGPALLLGLFSQELTGRLIVKDGPAAGTLYFYRGEPVWADDPLGDAGLHRRLVHKGRLPPDALIEAVAQGQLLGALVGKGMLTGQQMHDFMRELVRDVTLALTTATSGAYRFEEDRKFLDVAPLLRLNPFGLVLESRRKVLAPAQLLAMSSEIEGLFVIPGPGLGASSDKLSAFVRGARLSHIIDGTKTVRQVLDYTSLDQFMGTLVMLSLRDTRLVSLEPEARPVNAGGVTLMDGSVSSAEPEDVTLVDAEYPTDPPSSQDEARAREEIFGLYMRLKPLTVPRAVLGVGIDADLGEIEAAYASRMNELDPKRIPEGSAQQLLTARVDELRRKVTSAYQALKLQVAAQSGTNVEPLPGGRKSNPF